MTLFHRRCESLEASLRTTISDLRADLDSLRDSSYQRERELTDRLLAVMNPAAHAAIQAAARSNSPASGLPGIPIRKAVLPAGSAFRERIVGGGGSALLRPAPVAEEVPVPATVAKS